MRTLFSVLMLAAMATPALAEPVQQLPEPGSIGLAAAGIVAALWLGRKRKK